MGNFGTKPKPKADTNVPKRPSGNIHCTLSPSPSPTHTQPPIHAACPLPVCSVELYMSVSLSLYLSLYLSFLCVCVCAVSYYIRALVTCHLPLGRRVGGAVKASVLKGPVSVLSTWESSIQLDTSITSFWGNGCCPWLSVFLATTSLAAPALCPWVHESVSDTNCDDLSTPIAPTASISCGIRLLLGP